MRMALAIVFILAFVWIISVIVAIVFPSYIFGPFSYFFAVVGAVLILTIINILRG